MRTPLAREAQKETRLERRATRKSVRRVQRAMCVSFFHLVHLGLVSSTRFANDREFKTHSHVPLWIFLPVEHSRSSFCQTPVYDHSGKTVPFEFHTRARVGTQARDSFVGRPVHSMHAEECESAQRSALEDSAGSTLQSCRSSDEDLGLEVTDGPGRLWTALDVV